MNDDFRDPARSLAAPPEPEPPTLGMSSVYRLFEAFIALREKNDRTHKVFEQTLNKTRDTLQGNFNSFAADTQKAYQSLRQELNGEKKVSLVLFNELLELSHDLHEIVEARPKVHLAGEEMEALSRWMDAIEVQYRKVQATLTRHGIHPYDAVVGAPYNPALHERVGSCRVEGMEALRVAEQRDRGYASQQPEFVLRRPKVIVTE
jgi:molecular chaperone GrpE (heat shock protein)